MRKIKNLIAKMSDEIKELAKKFPLTMFLIGFVTILFTITIDQNFSPNLEKIYLFCVIWGIGTFFTETFFIKKQHKIISYGLTGGISFIFTQILIDPMLQNNSEMDVIYRIFYAYSLILIFVSLYKSIQNAELKFQEYVQKVFRDLFHNTVTYIILNIGIVLVTAIFIQLILDGHYGSVMERLLTLLFGLFYVPSLVYSFSSISKKEVSGFIKGLILYVLLPLVVISMAIIYLYIAKIILLRDMPQNTIYRILAGIFIVAFPVWNMATNYAEEKKIIAKITKLLPYLYTPFILLEIYSIGTRIHEFGITPMRYMSCLFIIFQVIALTLTFYKKSEKISQIFIYASVLAFISFVTPFHFENVSNWSQKRIIEKIMIENTDFEQLSTEDKDHVKSAYDYLKYETSDKKWIPNDLSDENKAKIEAYSNIDRRNYDYPEYIYLNCKLDLKIENYSKITYVQGENRDNENTTITLNDSKRSLDLNDKIDEIITQNENNKGNLEKDFEDNPIVKISETEDFYISRVSLSYYKTTKKLNFLSVEGYILER